MTSLYGLIFWIPAVASATMLLVAWRTDLLNRVVLFFGWFLVAFLIQYFAWSPPAWALGLVAQVALGVYLAIRFKLE